MQIHPVVAVVAVFAGSVRHHRLVPPFTSRPPWQPSLLLLRSTFFPLLSVVSSTQFPFHPSSSLHSVQYRLQIPGR